MAQQFQNIKLGSSIYGNGLKLYTLKEAKGLYADLHYTDYDEGMVLGVITSTTYSHHTFQAVSLDGKFLLKTNDRSYNSHGHNPDNPYGDFPYGVWH